MQVFEIIFVPLQPFINQLQKSNFMKVLRHFERMRYALMLLFLVSSLQLMAQSNLREGYVITLQDDTIHGEIDFRTAAMNMKQCVFRKKGETSFKTYLPGEISGYRFTSNGIYYVSKEVNTKEEGKKVLFVEFVLHGNMNLYQLGSDEMILEDQDGNLASFSYEKAQRSTDKKEIRDEMKDALIMLGKSYNATTLIMNRDKNRENTKKAVMAYVDEVCPDGFCEAYEYKNKTTPKEDRTMYYWVKVGLKHTSYKFYNDATVSGVSPQFSAGLDFHMNRLIKGLMFNVGLTFEPGKATKDLADVYKEDNASNTYLSYYERFSDIKFQQFDIMFGPGYQFKMGSMMLRTKCGGIFRLASHNFDYSITRYSYYSSQGGFVKKHTDENELRFDSQFGLYAGVGIEYPLKGFSIICDLDYIYDYNKWTKYAYEDESVLNQSGICLSAGIKF